MIDIPQAAAKLAAPAESLVELHERLGFYIGQTVSVESEVGADYEKIIARLETAALKVDKRYGRSVRWLEISLKGDIKKIRSGELHHSYQVLIDGIWKIIHDPAGTVYGYSSEREISA